jgi:hypothetical protein
MISAKEQAAIDEITAALGADRELPLWTAGATLTGSPARGSGRGAVLGVDSSS